MVNKENLEGFDKTIIDFLSAQKTGTRHTYKCFLKRILEFTGMTGEQLLASKRADTSFEWERKIIDFKQWMKQQKTPSGKVYSDNAANSSVTAIRSLFDYYRTPLKFSQGEKRKLTKKAQRVTIDYPLMNEDIAKMVFVGNLREKYVVLVGKSFGLRVGDFVNLTYGAYRSINLNQEAPIFLGDVQTEKEGVTAKPFVDNDALPILKAVLESNKDKADNERVIGVQEQELSTMLQTLASKAGIVLGGKHLRFHCLRKYLIDRLSSVTSESKWKKIVGKATSEDAYVSDIELKEISAKVMKLTTCINTNGNGKVSKLSEEVTKLQKEIEELKNSQNFVIQSTFQSLVSALEEKLSINIDLPKILAAHEAKYSKEGSKFYQSLQSEEEQENKEEEES